MSRKHALNEKLPVRLAIKTGKRANAWKDDHEHFYYHLPDVDDNLIFRHSYPCLQCGEVFEPTGIGTFWNSPSGRLEPGMVYWDDHIPENYYWDNHKGPHLMAVTPTGLHWCIDGRASNCGSPNDRLHRCWVRSGDPAAGTLHVGKEGKTCMAGAGSIEVGKDPETGKPTELYWHGFVTHGYWQLHR